MHEHLKQHFERIWRRAPIVSAVFCVTIAYQLFAGLGILASMAGILAVCAWAALWPEPAGNAAERKAGHGKATRLGAGGSIVDALPLSLLDGLADATLVLDARRQLVAGNAAAKAISPVVTGRPLSHWNRSPELLAAVDRASSTGLQQRCQVRLFTPVERSLDVLVTRTPGFDEATAQVVLITCRDLTEQEQLTRMRADFVANASHELRTPLASLRGFVETLQGAAKDDPAAQTRFLGIMQTQAERMSRLIEDLLSLSRIEMREHVAPTASVDLAAVVEDAVSTLKSKADASNIELSVKFAAGERALEVVADKDELAQVAQNLIQNAIKYGRKGGKVDVSMRRETGRIVLEVVDDGIGIAPEHLPRLTERFYRVSAKDSKDRGGTGLGLAIVKHIVNRHRGELTITSTPGKGSTFAVAFPIQAAMVG